MSRGSSISHLKETQTLAVHTGMAAPSCQGLRLPLSSCAAILGTVFHSQGHLMNLLLKMAARHQLSVYILDRKQRARWKG